MLPDKNELNDEMIEQINGGLEDVGLISGNHLDNSSDDSSKATGMIPNIRFRLNYEPEPLKTSISTGELKATVPDFSKKDKLIKIH